jgi:hypothetical protein
MSLVDLHVLQNALLPAKSVILAPGEAWTVSVPASGR